MKSKDFLKFGCMAALFTAPLQPALAQSQRTSLAVSNDAAAIQQLAQAILTALDALPAKAAKPAIQAQIAFATASQPKSVVAGALRLLLQRPTLKVPFRRALVDFISLNSDLNSFAGLAAQDLPFLAAGPSISGGGTGVNYGQ